MSTEYIKIPARLTLRVILALSILLLLLVSYWFTEYIEQSVKEEFIASLNRANEDVELVQQIGLLVVWLPQNTLDTSAQTDVRTQLRQTISQLEDNHNRLLHDNRSLSPELKTLYFQPPTQLDARINQYLDAARAVVDAPVSELSPGAPLLQPFSLAAQELLIEDLHTALSLFQSAAMTNLTNLDRFTYIRIGISILVLLAVWLGVFHPLLRRLRTETTALAQSYANTQSILNALPDVLFRLDREGTYLDYYTVDETALYVPPQEFLGKSVDEVLPAEISRKTRDAIRATLDGTTVQVFEYELANQYFEARLTKVKDDEVLVVVRDITSRKQAEKQLVESRELMIEAEHIAHLGHFVWRVDTNEMSLSDELYRIFGISPQEFRGTLESFLTQIFVNDRVRAQRSIEFAYREKNAVQAQWRIERPDKTLRTVEVRMVCRDDGLTIVGICHDISDLALAENKFQTIIENAPNAIIITDKTGKIVIANMRTTTLFGYPISDLLGQSIEMLIPERYRVAHRRHLLQYMRNPKPISRMNRNSLLFARRSDGSEFQAEISLSPIQTEHGMLTVIIVHDISQRVDLEKRLNQQVARLGLLSQITQAMNSRLDPQSILQTMLQYLEDAELIAIGSVCTYNPKDDTLALEFFMETHHAIAEALGVQRGLPVDIEPLELRPVVDNGMLYFPDLAAHPTPLYQTLVEYGFQSLLAVSIPTVQAIRVLVVVRREKDGFDQTDRDFFEQLSSHVALSMQHAELYQKLDTAYAELKQTQQAILSQERLRALGQMASGIAHDINNALVPIVGFTDLMLLHADTLTEQNRRYVARIRMSATDIVQIVSRMRQFYRQRNVQDHFTAVSLNKLVQEVIDLTAPRWKNMMQQQGIVINVRVDTADDLPDIAGEESELREALTNLVVNAVDAMPQGGEITIQTKHIGDTVRLAVSDTGIGMDEETRLQCLDPFFTTKGEAGTGLGLAMVFGIIKRHEAQLNIESTLGKGTTVWIDFPTSGLLAIKEIEANKSAEAEPIAPLKILCIDDDPATLALLREALTLDGHSVTTCDGGQSGLDEFQAHFDRGDPFDVVFTDLGMPYVDGRQVIRAIKRKSPDTPVILLTGWGSRFASEQDIPATDVILSKPPQVSDIRRGLRKIFSET